MKNIILSLMFLLMISGCYTLIDHPDIEVYYERENGEEFLTENYDVFVDEDCSTCHDEFLAQKHFSPLIPAHNTNLDWNTLPWWQDTKYLLFVSGNDSSESGGYGYQHVSSQKRTNIPSAQQGGYLPASGGGSSSSSSTSVTTSFEPSEGSSSRARATVSSQNSGNSSKSTSTSTTSKRKFRKRK